MLEKDQIKPIILEPGVYDKNKVNISDIIMAILRQKYEGIGALVFFIGIVKGISKSGKKVAKLVMESYEEHANKKIREICHDVKQKYGMSIVGIWHLIGSFKVGESVVLVTVGGLSRTRAFEALREAVERYKREPALFKKEVYVDGTYSWIEGS